jgi:hypothetical protein
MFGRSGWAPGTTPGRLTSPTPTIPAMPPTRSSRVWSILGKRQGFAGSRRLSGCRRWTSCSGSDTVGAAPRTRGAERVARGRNGPGVSSERLESVVVEASAATPMANLRSDAIPTTPASNGRRLAIVGRRQKRPRGHRGPSRGVRRVSSQRTMMLWLSTGRVADDRVGDVRRVGRRRRRTTARRWLRSPGRRGGGPPRPGIRAIRVLHQPVRDAGAATKAGLVCAEDFLAPTSRSESAALPASNNDDPRRRQCCRRSVSTRCGRRWMRAPTRMMHPFATTLSTPPRSPGSDVPNGVLQVVRKCSSWPRRIGALGIQLIEPA